MTVKSFWKRSLLWGASFAAFPVGGLLASMLVGPIDNVFAAAVGGAIAGTVIGAGQVLFSGGGRLAARLWIPLTSGGMSIGLTVGSAAVGYGTGIADLAVMGAITGLVVGLGQSLALPARWRYRWIWPISIMALWALGWVLSTLAAIDVSEQFTNFGASGAVVAAALSGLLLHFLLPRTSTAASHHSLLGSGVAS